MVQVGDDGRLVYQPTARGERMLDFSYCGYMGGGVALPNTEKHIAITLEPSADANGSDNNQTCVDDTARIQAAIDQLSDKDRTVKKGADIQVILLKAGTYYIQGELHIQSSGIVLRGEGDETILIAAGKEKRNLITINGGGPGPLYKKDGDFKITAEKVHLGETTFPVAHSGVLQVGDTVYVQRNTNVRKRFETLLLHFVELLLSCSALFHFTFLTPCCLWCVFSSSTRCDGLNDLA